MLGKRFVVISLLAGALALTAAMAPETLVRYIGGGLSPRAAISDSFMPVLRRMIAIAAGILSVLVMLLWYSRGVICHAIRMMVAEWRDLRIRIRQGGWGLSALECLGLGMVFAVALGIRLWYLRQPIAFDEATTVNLYASSPWYIAMANYSQPGNHILHTVLVRLAVVLGGYSEPIIRVPAFLAGLLCVPAAYLYARMVYSRGAGLMAAGWMASSLPFVYMSVNARGYTIVAFYGILAHVAILQLARTAIRIMAINESGWRVRGGCLDAEMASV